jgi:hypothetical protein
MNSFLKFAGLAVALVLFAVGANAELTTIFEDDFESYVDNADLGSEYDENTLGIGLHVGPDEFTLGSQSIGQATDDTTIDRLFIEPAWNLDAQDTIHVSFSLYDGGGDSAGLSFGRGAYGFVSLGAYTVESATFYAVRIMDGGPGWVVLEDAPRSEGWQDFKWVMSADLDYNTTVEVFHNGTSVYTSPSFELAVAAQGAYGNWVRFSPFLNTAGSVFYYDNFLVQTGTSNVEDWDMY